jgi:hypothetical protein
VILGVFLSGIGIARFLKGYNTQFVEWLNTSLCFFNLFGSIYLMRLMREENAQDGE